MYTELNILCTFGENNKCDLFIANIQISNYLFCGVLLVFIKIIGFSVGELWQFIFVFMLL